MAVRPSSSRRSSRRVAADGLPHCHDGRVVPDVVTVPAVADALRHITISGVFYCPSYLREPWGGTVPPMPGCVWFHVVTSGHCELVVGGDRVELRSGDLVLVPHGAGHRIEAGGPTEHPNIPDLPHEQQSEQLRGAAPRRGRSARRSWSAADCASSTPAPAACWTASRRSSTSAPFAARCSAPRSTCSPTRYGREVGSEAVISRLCDVLVIQAIRHWMTTGEATGSSWLQAMGDPQVGPALAALHAEPGEPWTVGSLAARAAMSRSAFAARFRDLLGQPVMGYLTELRMQLAVDLLHRTTRPSPRSPPPSATSPTRPSAGCSSVTSAHRPAGRAPRRMTRLHPDQPQRRHGSQGARLGRGAPWPMPAPPRRSSPRPHRWPSSRTPRRTAAVATCSGTPPRRCSGRVRPLIHHARRRAAGRRRGRARVPFVGPPWGPVGAREEAGVDRVVAVNTNAVKHFKHELRGKRRIHRKPGPARSSRAIPGSRPRSVPLRPRVIVALGATAARSVLGRTVSIGTSRDRASKPSAPPRS